MATAGDLILKAMRRSGVLGVGQSLQAQDTSDALADLNQMLAQWAHRRWLVYHLVDTAFQCTGATSYTVGPGQNFNIARPDRIEAAFLRQTAPAGPLPVDFPLFIIESYEEYSRITVKSLNASPSNSIFYDSGFPTGRVYPYPIPNTQFQLHLLTKAVLPEFGGLSEEIILPDFYADAIDWNLRARFRSAYRLPIDPYIIGQAKAALGTIRRANLQLTRLVMPSTVGRDSRYNIYSDQGN